jgi:TrmH family RNA methyltransferase
VYNPKVIQATMGSIGRVNVIYTSLNNFLDQTKLPIYGAFMDGEVVYNTLLPKDAILIMGNESNGISAEINSMVQHKISIPRFGKLLKTESLNVATATAILLSEFRRKF